MSNKAKAPANQAKPATQAPAPQKAGFDAKQWAKNGISEEEVTAAKTAFDLFDSDQGGSVDIRGITLAMHRAQSRHDIPRLLIQKRSYLPNDC